MNPLISGIVGSFLRMALGGVVAWLIQNGALQPDQEASFYSGVTAALIGAGWIVYTNVIRKRTLNTAAALPPVSIDVVDAIVKSGEGAPANSPASAVPNIPTPERL